MRYTKEQIISEIQAVAKKLQKKTLLQTEFMQNSKISKSTVANKFGSWEEAVKEAGLDFISSADYSRIRAQDSKIDDTELLQELIRLFQEYGKEPTISMLNSKGKYSETPYKKRWGSLSKAFAMAKKMTNQDTPQPVSSVSPSISQAQAPSPALSDKIKYIPATQNNSQKRSPRQLVGEPINFRGLRFAPISEQGVVYLFGMISTELGYLIETVRTGFPDCEGKRIYDKKNNQWEHIFIEFEYKSSNYVQHGHPIEGCDLIVCWIHDWKDCPLEVLELKSVLDYL